MSDFCSGWPSQEKNVPTAKTEKHNKHAPNLTKQLNRSRPPQSIDPPLGVHSSDTTPQISRGLPTKYQSTMQSSKHLGKEKRSITDNPPTKFKKFGCSDSQNRTNVQDFPHLFSYWSTPANVTNCQYICNVYCQAFD